MPNFTKLQNETMTAQFGGTTVGNILPELVSNIDYVMRRPLPSVMQLAIVHIHCILAVSSLFCFELCSVSMCSINY